ncbi:hypothetical protein LINPERPRIM_LOCUS25210 [Linum perenne]
MLVREMLLALSIADKSRNLLMRRARELRDDHASLRRRLDTEESDHLSTRNELAQLTEAHSRLQNDLSEANSTMERLNRSPEEAKEAASSSAKNLQDQEALHKQIQILTKERDAAIAAQNREAGHLKRIHQLTEEGDKARKLAEAMTVERDHVAPQGDRGQGSRQGKDK